MRAEALRSSAPVEPARLDPGKQAETARRSLPGTGKKPEEDQQQKGSDIEEVRAAVELLNKTMENYSTQLKFSLHEASGEYIVRVINTSDNTVIREIPPERVLDMVAHFKEMLGIIVDKFI
ncbi:MAG: flagellar protein FlaG [Peptococcaceae bacterium]|nr:flagellar protein FlaG [Peptococcaceae bacterium]